MKLKRSQQGITLLSMVIVLAVLGFFAYCGMKIFPMYSEFSSVKDGMDAVAKEPKMATAPKGQVLDKLYRHFSISYVSSVKPDHITIDTKKGAKMSVKYEVRTPLMYNLDIVGKFEYTVDLSG
ncbi:DUF4845 domain-containing protein [Pseudomarimonas arenosa]|uniref:DUF4845 domain-containing protein n=1 Tax=Pseudomarimonas arenosa TaxID=2774145 RepID=A0AAW3ZKI0_9GAMM|nr:DUF4845 domain-containing protein [Pseudomarimonas arenosa]MBD8524811.1 DUF4845 domain-containing protein [Pseudomarimonas arenosa]